PPGAGPDDTLELSQPAALARLLAVPFLVVQAPAGVESGERGRLVGVNVGVPEDVGEARRRRRLAGGSPDGLGRLLSGDPQANVPDLRGTGLAVPGGPRGRSGA